MNNHITIHKHNLFPFGEDDGDSFGSVVVCIALGAVGKRRLRDDHFGGHDARRTVQAFGKELQGSCPAFVDSPLKGLARSLGPEIAVGGPSVLLEESAELIVAKPEQAEVCVIPKAVLGASHSLHGFVVEPVDVGVSVPRVSHASVDIPSVHRPEVRGHIQVCLHHIGTDVCVEKRRNKSTEHCSWHRLRERNGNANIVTANGLGR